MIALASCADTSLYKHHCAADFLVDRAQLTDFSFGMDSTGSYLSRRDDFTGDTRNTNSTSSCGFQGSAIHIDRELNVELDCSPSLPRKFVVYLESIKELLESKFEAERNGHQPDLTPVDVLLASSAGGHKAPNERNYQYQQKPSTSRKVTNQISVDTRHGSLPDATTSNLKRSRAKDKTAMEADADERLHDDGSEETAELEPESRELDIFDDAAVLGYFTVCLKHIQQQTCRTIAQDWIRAIHPKKQAKFPYSHKGSKDKSRAPPWWPTGWKDKSQAPPWWPTEKHPPQIEPVPHIEPAHIKTRARVDLLLWILEHMDEWGPNETGRPLDIDNGYFGHPTVEDLRKATDENKARYTKEAHKWLDTIYHVKQHWRLVKDGGRGEGPCVLSLDWPRKGPRGGKKRQKVADDHDSAAQPKEVSSDLQVEESQVEGVKNEYDSDMNSPVGEWDPIDSASPIGQPLPDEPQLADGDPSRIEYSAQENRIQLEELRISQAHALATAPGDRDAPSQPWASSAYPPHQGPSPQADGHTMQPMQQSVYTSGMHAQNHESGFANPSNQTEPPTSMGDIWRHTTLPNSSAAAHSAPQAHLTQQQTLLQADPRSNSRQPYLGLPHPGSEVLPGIIQQQQQQQQFVGTHSTADDWRPKYIDPPILVTQPPMVQNLRTEHGPLTWHNAETAWPQHHSNLYLPHHHETRLQHPVQSIHMTPGFGQPPVSPPGSDDPHNSATMNAGIQRLPPMPQYQSCPNSGHPNYGNPGF